MIQFEFPTINRKQEAIEYIEEFHTYNSEIHGSGGLDIKDYEGWLVKTKNYHTEEHIPEGKVGATTYFAIDTDTNTIVGMVNIRHYLNKYLLESGSGHIGYSVRPTERRKGYATQILQQALQVLKEEYHVTKALVGCYEHNIGSKRTIEKNGGILDRRIKEEDGQYTLAFYINTLL